MSSDEWAARMADEIIGLAPMEWQLTPQTVLVIVGVMQLAKRHPRLPPNTREVIDRFIEGARLFFAECPSVLQAIAMGEDPAYDERGRL